MYWVTWQDVTPKFKEKFSKPTSVWWIEWEWHTIGSHIWMVGPQVAEPFGKNLWPCWRRHITGCGPWDFKSLCHYHFSLSPPSSASFQLLLHRCRACLSACCRASHHDGDGRYPSFELWGLIEMKHFLLWVALAMVSLHGVIKVTKTLRFAPKRRCHYSRQQTSLHAVLEEDNISVFYNTFLHRGPWAEDMERGEERGYVPWGGGGLSVKNRILTQDWRDGKFLLCHPLLTRDVPNCSERSSPPSHRHLWQCLTDTSAGTWSSICLYKSGSRSLHCVGSSCCFYFSCFRALGCLARLKCCKIESEPSMVVQVYNPRFPGPRRAQFKDGQAWY